ncbi:MAG: hypothetical protein Kow0063_18640 [Anaerolineae bacterium]
MPPIHSSAAARAQTAGGDIEPWDFSSGRSVGGTGIPPDPVIEGLPGQAVGDSLLRTWLDGLGLHFDPFLPLDAAADPHLSDYLVGHEAFAVVWGDGVSFVFAPAGGGKTALRVRTAQACRVGQETNRPFPIPYIPPFLAWGHSLPSLDDHLAALARAGAIQLLLALAHRPHWLLRLGDAAIRHVRNILTWNLPGPLPRYLELLRQSSSPQPLQGILDPTFVLSDPPDPATLSRLCDALTSSPPDHATPPPARTRWDALRVSLLEQFGFRSIYILMDGLDAAPETAGDPQAVVSSILPLLPLLPEWSARRVFVKGFLPLETQPLLDAHPSAPLAYAQRAVIHWNPSLLAEVVRRRVYVASEGAFGSLDAITSPALRDVETMLAQAVVPLPREMLVLTRRVLIEHVRRSGSTGKIQEADVEGAIRWYANHKIASGKWQMEAPDEPAAC